MKLFGTTRGWRRSGSPFPGAAVLCCHTCSTNALASLSAHSYAPGTLSPYAPAFSKGFFKNKSLRCNST